jgi:hypothetical protein
MRYFLIVTALLGVEFGAHAASGAAVRPAAEKSANWLILQFDLKKKTYDSVTAPEQLAMVLKGLCEHPRDYKEANGPYMTEPVKYILSKIDDKGHVDGIAMNEAEALQWSITGLKATKNDKYAPVMERMRARVKELGKPEFPKFEASHLTPMSVTPESMRNAIAAVLHAAEEGKKEIEVDGKPVKWGEVLGESVAKLQQPDGSFGPDIQTNAMALVVLDLCLKGL